jgi:hypothetical protein
MSNPDRGLTKNEARMVIALSVPLIMLLAGVSLFGIFSPGFYAKETQNWQVQAIGQDIIDLVLIVPVLSVTTLMTLKIRKRIAFPLWGGVILYLIYTFTIYSFDVHFNKLFVFYCLALGLAFYSFLYFGYRQLKEPAPPMAERTVLRKVIGIYFMAIAAVFYTLWLSELLPAITSDSVPKGLTESGLPTNPVHVLDLAVVLPGIFITGVLLLRNNRLALILTPVTLVFFILMDITIGSLSIMMLQKGLGDSLALAMGTLSLFSLVLLIGYLRSSKA